MKRLGQLTLCSFCILAAGSLFTQAWVNGQTAQEPSVAISGTVAGASGKHAIYVALWDKHGYLVKPVQGIRIAAGTSATFQFRVPPGQWALSAFEDRNDNGILDSGVFGPKEPSGFWRDFHAWRKPRFDDVSSRYDKDTSGIEIRLH